MNIDFFELEKFCTTKLQLKAVGKLKKKFSITNVAHKVLLEDLMGSFFIHDQLQPLKLIAPELLTVKFAGDFNKWSGVEILLGVLLASKVLDTHQKEIIFSILKSIENYPYTDKLARKINSSYIQDKLSLRAINGYFDKIQKSIDDNDLKYEYAMRLGLLAEAAIVQVVNQNNDKELTEKLDNIIQEQEKFLKEERLKKYS